MVSPQDILSSVQRPPQWRGRVSMRSGRMVDPLNLTVEEVDPLDIAYGLAHTFRYGGHLEPAITVAEHSMLVMKIITVMWPATSAPLLPAALLHDACEAYTHDLPSPLRKKVHLRQEDGSEVSWDDLDRRVNEVVFKRFKLDPGLLDLPEIQAADILACSLEVRDSKSHPGAVEDWGLPPVPDCLRHYRTPYWAPREAQSFFSNWMFYFGMR